MKKLSSKRLFDSGSRNLEFKIKNLTATVGVALVFALTTGVTVTQAQQSAKIPRIGFLAQVSSTAISARIDAFRQGLRELAMWRDKTSTLNGAMRPETQIA